MTRPAPSLHADEGGQITALAVLSAAAFACLLMLVINTGYATSGKIEMQNSADAAAVSGATWVARGLNVISLNNVTETQLLAIMLIVPALEKAAPLAETTLEVEQKACALLVYGAPVCAAIIQAQIVILKGYRVFINAAVNAKLGERDGPLWKAMQLLSKISGVVGKTFYGVAVLEGNRIARQNGAEAGILIPAQFQLTLPVREGAVKPDLCVPTKDGKPGPEALQVGGYSSGEGPLENYAKNLGLLWFPIENSLIRAYFWGFRQLEYQGLCGGPGVPPPTKERAEREYVRSREECVKRGGGTAVWAVTMQRSGSLPVRQVNPRFGQVAVDPKDSDALADHTWRAPCDREPPGTKTARGYEQVREIVTREPGPDGNPIASYSYELVQYGFVGASLNSAEKEKDDGKPTDGRAAQNDDPTPYLLDDDAEEKLRYLAVVYRSREIQAAAGYFKAALGPHRLAYAQARVYNPTAFDTFTQDWRVTLEPASLLDLGLAGDGLRDPGALGRLSQDGAAGFDAIGAILDALNVPTGFNNH
jgi:hypothetical protein